MDRKLFLVYIVLALIGCYSERETQVQPKDGASQVQSEEHNSILIDLPMYKIRMHDYPYGEGHESFYHGKVKKIVTYSRDSDYIEGTNVYIFSDNGHLLSSRIDTDGSSYEKKYTYNDLMQLSSIQVIDNEKLDDTWNYTYEEVNADDIYIIGTSEENGKENFSERISYDNQNSEIISKVRDPSRENIFTFVVEQNRIISVDLRSDLYHMRRSMEYSPNGNLLIENFFRNDDILYRVDEYSYDENGCLIKIKIVDVEENQVLYEVFFSDFDDNGNWLVEEVKEDLKTTLTVKRSIEYYTSE